MFNHRIITKISFSGETLKAIEMAGIGFGPFCAMMLVDMGAEVVLIDRPNSKGSKFEVMNRGKRRLRST